MHLAPLFILYFTIGQVSSHDWGELNDFKYYVDSSALMNHLKATDVCSEMNGTLAKVDSLEIQRFLERLLVPWKFYHVGLTLNQATKTFQWPDGTEAGFLQWSSKATDGAYWDEGCVMIRLEEPNNWQWFHANCTVDRAGYICQKRLECIEKGLLSCADKGNPQMILAGVIFGIALFILLGAFVIRKMKCQEMAICSDDDDQGGLTYEEYMNVLHSAVYVS